MDAIKKRMNAYIESLLIKEDLTPDEYMILVYEHERRKQDSIKHSEDTIMRIFANID